MHMAFLGFRVERGFGLEEVVFACATVVLRLKAAQPPSPFHSKCGKSPNLWVGR